MQRHDLRDGDPGRNFTVSSSVSRFTSADRCNSHKHVCKFERLTPSLGRLTVKGLSGEAVAVITTPLLRARLYLTEQTIWLQERSVREHSVDLHIPHRNSLQGVELMGLSSTQSSSG